MALRKLLLIISLFIMGDCFGQSPMIKLIAKRQSAVSCTYPLDTYTGSIGAYSVAFKLRTAYSGSAFRVRESGGNTEQDIGFDGCHVDTAALKSFVGSNDGYIVTLYDQEGSNNVTQSTQANQPRIVNAGVIERLEGEPTMYFDGSSDNLRITSYQNKSRIDIYFLHSTSDAQYIHFNAAVNNLEFSFVAQDASGSTLVTSNFGASPSLYANGSAVTTTTRNDIHDGLTGTKIVTMENAATTNAQWTSSGFNFSTYSSYYFQGYISQIIAWDSDQSANRAAIIAAFNSQFSVY